MSSSRPQSERRSCSSRGFSLLELILVMLIMAGVLAMVAPRFRGFAASRQVRDAAASIVTLTKWARLQAIREGRPYRLNVDIEEGEYWLEARVGANFEELGVSLGQLFMFPEGMTVQWEESDTAEQNGYVEFDAGGRAQPATLRLIGRLGTVMDVVCEAPTEPFRVEHRPEEEYRYE